MCLHWLVWLFSGETASCVSGPCLGTAKEQRGSALREKQAEWVTKAFFKKIFSRKKRKHFIYKTYLEVSGVYISFIDLQFILS